MMDTKKCPHCGKQLHKDAQYCMYCMTSLCPKKDITPKAVSHWKLAFFCAALLIIVIVLLLCVLLRSCGMKQSAPDGQATETTTALTPEEEKKNPIPESTSGAEQTDGEEKTGDPSENDPTRGPFQPTETNASLQCNHIYTAANCLTPVTCTLCGKTVGTPDSKAHTWEAVTSVVHHEEQWHTETVEVPYKKTVYLCFFCGYNQKGYDTLDLLREHVVVHSNAQNYETIIARPDLLADTREEWAVRTEEKRVVDKKAYDETVITGYICKVCNMHKSAEE